MIIRTSRQHSASRRNDEVHATTELNAAVIERTDRYRVTVEQYVTFRKRGFVVIPQLVAHEEVAELRQHTEDLMQGRLPQQSRQMSERDLDKDHGVTVQDLEAPPAHLSP